MIGKIVKITDLLGFIEYDIDKRISFKTNDLSVSLGDTVDFEIVHEKINNSDKTYEQAKITNVVSKQQTVNKQFFRLSKAARELNIGISTIIDVLYQYGFNISAKPNTKITEEQFQILTNHFLTKKEVRKKGVSNEFERGTVIETYIERIINPSLLILNFTHEKKAYLELKNLAWNLARAENTFSNLKEKDIIQVVILENNSKYVVVSRKHLIPKPNETDEWQKLKTGQQIKGSIQEILINKIIIRTEYDFYGIASISTANKNMFIVGQEVDFVLNNKDELTQFLTLNIEVDEVTEEEEAIIREDYQTQDSELISFQNFKKSTYYSFSNEKDKKDIERFFAYDNKLFSSAISLKDKLYLSFGFNTPAWEIDFKKSLLPYLNDDITEKEALKFLSNQKYWIRINSWIDRNDGSVKNNWILFNEEILLSGFALSETDECDFIITKLSIKRTKKKSSKRKEYNLNQGTFLLNNGVCVLSPFDSKPVGLSQRSSFIQIQNKVIAFQILNKLKKVTGAILREEGLSIAIFDKFLEYQEAIERKGKENSRIKIETYKKIPHTQTNIAIEVEAEIDDLFGGESDENQLISIKTEEKSHKEKEETELVWYSDAYFESSNDKTKIHIKETDKPLDLLDKGFFVERKVSIRQFQVQREVIKDFFDKKLKLDHIESLLVRPERISPPLEPNLEYINKLLEETEKKQPKNNQVKAVKKAVGNNNIFLIQGPPGTGKTTVIAEVVEQLVKRGEKVLVTSQTHIAVDNVLEKVAKNNSLTCIRLGNTQRIKDNLLSYQIDKLIGIYSADYEKLIETNISLANYLIEVGVNYNFNEVRESLKKIIIDKSNSYTESFRNVLLQKNYDFLEMLSNTPFYLLSGIIDLLSEWKNNVQHEKEILIKPLLYKSVDVVFATCIGVRTDKELNEYGLKFDTVIIDEAGKANISESLAAISMAKKVILVGDQMQLPPYIDGSLLDEKDSGSFPRSKYGHKFLREDIQHALKTSFFEFLINRISKKQFPEQNKELLNYQHRMHPHIGEFISDSFYEGRVQMGEHTYNNTLKMPSPFDKEIIFINTSSAQKPFESFDGFSAKNDSEAFCISSLIVPKLLDAGLTPKDFAIIAPYKSQVSHIRKALKNNNHNSHLIDVSTLDSFQGMEFDVIVFSFTRSASPEQKNKKVGFLDDARRLNVAFSRAKKKLILVGNSETLTDSRSHFDSLFNYTGLFSKLVELSKNNKIGNFVELTDYSDLKSPFELFVEKHEKGSIVEGKIKRIENYGAFVSLGNVDGLIYISDLSWDKISYPNEVVSVNQEVKVKILDYNLEKKQISLGLKQALPDPWDNFNYSRGERIIGEIENIVDYGLFIELTKGITGLLHISNIPLKLRFNLKQNFKIGMPIYVLIYKIRKEKKQISLKLIKS